MGYAALLNNTTNGGNTAIGDAALTSSNGGYYNVAVGYLAADELTTGVASTFIGVGAGESVIGAHYNTLVGYYAGGTLDGGGYNVLLGSAAGDLMTTGNQCQMIGHDAGSSGTNAVTASQCTFIGSYSHGSSTSSLNQLVLGYNVACTGDANFTFGNASTDSNIAHGATSITAPSDARLKEEVEDEKVGLDFINELRPVTFRWKKANEVPSDMRAYDADSDERVMNGKYNHGFIAQEVKEVIDRHDLKDGFDMWSEDIHDGGRQRIGEGALMPLMVKAVQELSAKVDDLTEKLNNCNCE